MFPVIKGVPAMLTEHIDRNPSVQLLLGWLGYKLNLCRAAYLWLSDIA